jgi:hypothetical protein
VDTPQNSDGFLLLATQQAKLLEEHLGCNYTKVVGIFISLLVALLR